MSFLRNYLTYAGGNEAPELFHVWSGISALASVVSRKIWIHQGYYTYYPNLYVVLVGDPGGGKSTALDIAKAFIRSLKTIPLSADVTTVQGLLREMSREDSPCKRNFKNDATKAIVEYTPLTIFAGELVNFLSMDPYGWVNFLTTVYHEEVHEVKTKNKGDDLILGPFINMLACLTPDTTANMLHQKIISSGFARRTVFIWGEGRGTPVPFPTITPVQAKAMEECKAWAEKLMSPKFHGEITWDPEAREWYSDWYINLRNNIHSLASPTTQGYFESKHVQLQKAGMLLSVSESTDLVLRLPHLQAALHFLEQGEKNLERVFDGSGRNEQAGIAAKVQTIILNSREPMKLKKLQHLMFHDCDRDELDKIIHHLVDIKKLYKGEMSTNGVHQGTYIGTKDQMEWLAKKMGGKVDDSAIQPASPRNETFVDL